jgi:8-oxo-dGTP pyrophosphatase MutT (NUDIX family)
MLVKEDHTLYEGIGSWYRFVVDKVAAIWVLRRDGTALLQHRDDKPGLRHAGMWVPPGGHADPGESMPECARRELKEETEYDAPELQFLMCLDRVHDDGVAFQVTYFWCWYDEIQTTVCHEGQELAFIKRTDAADYQVMPFLLDVWDSAITAASAIPEIVQP